MTADEWPERIPPLAGLVGVTFGVVATAVDQMWLFPPTTSTAAEIAVFAGANRSSLLAAMVLNIAAVTLLLVFGVGVWVRLRGVADDFLTACFGFGLVTFVTLLLAGFTFFSVLVYRAPDVPATRVLYDASFGLLAMSGPPTSVALGAYAVVVFRSRNLPRWTAHLAIVAALTHVVLLASLIVRDGFFSLEGPVIMAIPATLFVWIAGTSTAMLADGQ